MNGASLVAQRLKRLPAMRETWVQSLGREDPLKKEMAANSSILAWRTPWMEEPGGLQSSGSQRAGHEWATSLSHLQFSSVAQSYLTLWDPMDCSTPGFPVHQQLLWLYIYAYKYANIIIFFLCTKYLKEKNYSKDKKQRVLKSLKTFC